VGQIEGARDLSDPEAHLAATIQPDARNSESPRMAGYAAATGIFAGSRLIVFLAILFSVRFAPPAIPNLSRWPSCSRSGRGLWRVYACGWR
jgi:hypothetical protein